MHINNTCRHQIPDNNTELCCAVLAAVLTALCNTVMCRVDAAASKAGNSSAPHSAQRALGQTVEVVPENGTFGSKAVAGVTVPKVNIANLFANRVSHCHQLPGVQL